MRTGMKRGSAMNPRPAPARAPRLRGWLRGCRFQDRCAAARRRRAGRLPHCGRGSPGALGQGLQRILEKRPGGRGHGRVFSHQVLGACHPGTARSGHAAPGSRPGRQAHCATRRCENSKKTPAQTEQATHRGAVPENRRRARHGALPGARALGRERSTCSLPAPPAPRPDGPARTGVRPGAGAGRRTGGAGR